jgi:hypothetical protein
MSNIDIMPFNNKSQRHGLWESYLFGELWYRIFFQNGERVGYGETYDYEYDGKSRCKQYNI